jgi:hypothetical protein
MFYLLKNILPLGFLFFIIFSLITTDWLAALYGLIGYFLYFVIVIKGILGFGK